MVLPAAEGSVRYDTLPLSGTRHPPWRSARRDLFDGRVSGGLRSGSDPMCTRGRRPCGPARPWAPTCCRPRPLTGSAPSVERGERLPQKSTYFWPKPRTGMVMMPLDLPAGLSVDPAS